jgi:hypothetical protein
MVLKHQDSLEKFLRAMGSLDKNFCDLMVGGSDFVLKLEIRGNKGELLHAKVHHDEFHRPNGVEKRVEAKSSKALHSMISANRAKK